MKHYLAIHNQVGASLVELMATVTIMGTVAGIGTPIVMNHIEEAKTQVDLYNLRIVADALRYAWIIKGEDMISISEGPIETATISLKNDQGSSVGNMPLRDFIADPVHHKETAMLAELPKTRHGTFYVIQKQVPVGKPYEMLAAGDIYYITIP